MTTGRELQRRKASKKGWTAVGAGALTTLSVMGAVSVGSTFLVVGLATVGGLWTGQKVYSWFRYRGEWGLKF